MRHEGNDDLRRFMESMEAAIRAVGAPPPSKQREFLAFQIAQGDRLVELEDQFRRMLVKHRLGKTVYRRFVQQAQDGSVLSARPYFRARQGLFSRRIGPALTRGDARRVQDFPINYRFVRYAMSQVKLGRQFQEVADQIIRLRKQICILLMPLALSRIRIFWARTSRNHLSYLDMLDVCVEGMLSAVDKFQPPFKRVFRAVVICRMLSVLMDRYSETSVHFYPGDRRRLYRANKLAGKVRGTGLDELDYDDIVRQLRKKDPADKVSPQDLASMMAAASTVSIDTAPAGVGRAVRSMTTSEEEGPEALAARAEALTLVARAVERLRSLREKKLLRMKGMLPTFDGLGLEG